MTDHAHRLPRTVWPTRYSIDIDTDIERPEFFGSVTIDLDIQQPVHSLQLHAKALKLSEAQLTTSIGPIALDMKMLPERETVELSAPDALPIGAAQLSIQFRGQPNPGLHGLYWAEDGHQRVVATQCEATDARSIFPCFDEPEFKAALQWTVRTDPDLVALANGRLERTELADGRRVWRFHETPPVSSYLAAMTVGRFEGTSPTTVNGIPIRVWAPETKKGQASFAQEFTQKILPYYETYFDIPYAFDKYDQVAVPGFDAGAMENVGLVLFRQNLLLMDPKSASWNQQKLIAKVIAHELAHMWFGNLVTMKWWDDLWLNEAFAEWFAHKAVNDSEPAYLVWNDFQSDKNRALMDDALRTTHPIYTSVSTPDQALEMFDVITYQKGCSIMRMLENFLGEAPFRDGIRAYMKAFNGKNAQGSDLWSHLAKASGQPVGELMRSWIEQDGFPVVDAELTGNELQLAQRRFFSSPEAAREPNQQLWNVPIVVRFEDDTGIKEQRFILDREDHQVQLDARGPLKWCYANAEEIGFYRVNHRGLTAEALLTHGLDKLSIVEQMGFIEDQWALVQNGAENLERFFPIIETFSKSPDHNVIRATVDRLSTLDRLLAEANETTAREALWAHIGRLFGPHLDDLGFEPKPNESQNDAQRRALVIHTLGSMARVSSVIERCERFAELERKDPRSIDANLAGTFVGVTAKFGDARRYDDWETTYKNRKSSGAPPQDAARYLYTLAAFRPEALVSRTLDHLESGLVPQEAVGSILGQMLASLHGQEQAWTYLQNNWLTLESRVGDMGISRVVESVGRLPPARRGDIVAFFERNPPKAAERALARALENLDQRTELGQRIVPELLSLIG